MLVADDIFEGSSEGWFELLKTRQFDRNSELDHAHRDRIVMVVNLDRRWCEVSLCAVSSSCQLSVSYCFHLFHPLFMIVERFSHLLLQSRRSLLSFQSSRWLGPQSLDVLYDLAFLAIHETFIALTIHHVISNRSSFSDFLGT